MNKFDILKLAKQEFTDTENFTISWADCMGVTGEFTTRDDSDIECVNRMFIVIDTHYPDEVRYVKDAAPHYKVDFKIRVDWTKDYEVFSVVAPTVKEAIIKFKDTLVMLGKFFSHLGSKDANI